MSEGNENLKKIVKDKYAAIAQQSKMENETSCCGSGGCCGVDYTIFSENYNHLQGYNPDADLGLGCGLPTEFAHIKKAILLLTWGQVQATIALLRVSWLVKVER